MTYHCDRCDGENVDYTTCSGCPSCADLQAKLDAIEQITLKALRYENNTLRSHIAELEEDLAQARNALAQAH